ERQPRPCQNALALYVHRRVGTLFAGHRLVPFQSDRRTEIVATRGTAWRAASNGCDNSGKRVRRFDTDRTTERLWRRGEPVGERDESLSAPAQGQPGRLVLVGRGGARSGEARGQTDARQHRVLGLPLVPRDGARVV